MGHSWRLNSSNRYESVSQNPSIRIEEGFHVVRLIVSATRNEVFDPEWDLEKAVFYASGFNSVDVTNTQERKTKNNDIYER